MTDIPKPGDTWWVELENRRAIEGTILAVKESDVCVYENRYVVRYKTGLSHVVVLPFRSILAVIRPVT
jgi:hypothetical protein